MRKKTAFTLIEILIVVAIMAIIAASSLAYVVAPGKELSSANAAIEQEAGFSMLARFLVEDAHGSRDFVADPDAEEFRFTLADGQEVSYRVDSDRRLIRTSDSLQEIKLVREVETFTISKMDDALIEVRVIASQPVVENELVLERTMQIALGDAWMGGAR